jgi:hypothetical protein
MMEAVIISSLLIPALALALLLSRLSVSRVMFIFPPRLQLSSSPEMKNTIERCWKMGGC